MAIFPCDVCRKRYSGKSNTAYIGWSAGSFQDRHKLNLCQSHADALSSLLEKSFNLVERGGVLQTDDTEVSRTCESCNAEPSTQTYYVNLYVRSRDPEVWVKGVCEQCGQTLSQNLPQAA